MDMKLKGLFCMVVCTLLLYPCTGCSSLTKDRNSSNAEDAQPSKLVIGLSIASFQDERWLMDRDIFVAKCNQLGADVVVLSANGNEKLQESQCEKLISQKVDALVVLPQNSDTTFTIAQAARDANVPIIAYDRLIRNCQLDGYVTYDNVKIGQLQATYLVKKAPKGNYILLGGYEKDYCAVLLRQGQMEVLQPYIDSGDINIVTKKWTTDWNPYVAKTIVEDALSENNDNIQAILVSNDGTAGGAIQALAQKKLAGKVAVSGQDADLAGCQRIAEGTQSMTVYVPIKAEAEACATAAIALANGEAFNWNSTFNNGKMDVPTFQLTPISVDKNNLDETVIKDGFQKAEDVYRNVTSRKTSNSSAHP